MLMYARARARTPSAEQRPTQAIHPACSNPCRPFKQRAAIGIIARRHKHGPSVLDSPSMCTVHFVALAAKISIFFFSDIPYNAIILVCLRSRFRCVYNSVNFPKKNFCFSQFLRSSAHSHIRTANLSLFGHWVFRSNAVGLFGFNGIIRELPNKSAFSRRCVIVLKFKLVQHHQHSGNYPTCVTRTFCHIASNLGLCQY